MIVTQGGLEGSYGLYLREGKPTFVYNYFSIKRPTFAANEPLPAAKAKIVVDFAYDGKKCEVGKGGTVTLSVNGKAVAQGKLERTAPYSLSIGEGLDVGEDVGSAVDFTYKLPFKFTGKIEKVTVELK